MVNHSKWVSNGRVRFLHFLPPSLGMSRPLRLTTLRFAVQSKQMTADRHHGSATAEMSGEDGGARRQSSCYEESFIEFPFLHFNVCTEVPWALWPNTLTSNWSPEPEEKTKCQ